MAANMFKDKVRFSVNKTSVHGYVQAALVKIGGKECEKKQPSAQTDEKPDESYSQTKDFISRLVIFLKTVFRVIIWSRLSTSKEAERPIFYPLPQ